MFPLGSVLLPGEALPLHVFEPRYRALVEDCLAAPEGPRFGVVLIARGHEVGGGDERHDIGVVARIAHHEATDDGRYALLCVGAERIRVQAWLADDPYPLAAVEPVTDAEVDAEAFDASLPAVLDALDQSHELLWQLASTLGRDAPAVPDVVPAARASVGDRTRSGSELTRTSFAVASAAPLGAADRLRVLAAPDAISRLAVLTEAIDDTNAALRFRLSEPPADRGTAGER
jgi:ATP-dependent Lon protease